MTRQQLIQKLRKYCRKRKLAFEVDTRKGKGSHYTVTVGDKSSILQSDLNPGRITRFLNQVDVDPADL